MSRRIRARGKRLQVHVHTEAFRPDPCHGQLMGFPDNIRFDWQTWLNQRLVDGITLRTSWFEAMEDPFSAGAQRSRLPNALQDPVVKEALSLCNRLGIPAYLNRYIHRAVNLDEYLEDLARITTTSAGRIRYLRICAPGAADRTRRARAYGGRLDRLRAKAGAGPCF